MKTKTQWIYLYAGYYEMYITDEPLDAPYSLISKHKTVEAAANRAEKEHPGDDYFYKEDLFPEDLNYILDDPEDYEIVDIQGQSFIIV